MSSIWSRNLYNKLKLQKSKKISELSVNDNCSTQKELLRREGEEKLLIIHDHEDKIIELQKIISENILLLNSTDGMIQEEKNCIMNMSKEFEETQHITVNVIQEHGKFKSVDHMMAIKKMYEELKKNTVDETTVVHKEFGKIIDTYIHKNNNNNNNIDDSSIEEKSITSFEGNESILSNNDSNSDTVLKDIDYNSININGNSNINNSYDIARKSIHRITDRLKQKIALD
jgi:hypothetical protein